MPNIVLFIKTYKTHTQHKANLYKLYKYPQMPNTTTIPCSLQMITITGIKIKYIV